MLSGRGLGRSGVLGGMGRAVLVDCWVDYVHLVVFREWWLDGLRVRSGWIGCSGWGT